MTKFSRKSFTVGSTDKEADMNYRNNYDKIFREERAELPLPVPEVDQRAQPKPETLPARWRIICSGCLNDEVVEGSLPSSCPKCESGSIVVTRSN